MNFTNTKTNNILQAALLAAGFLLIPSVVLAEDACPAPDMILGENGCCPIEQPFQCSDGSCSEDADCGYDSVSELLIPVGTVDCLGGVCSPTDTTTA
jgi:hypothetical protein